MRLTLEEVTLNNSNRKEFSHFSDLLNQEQKELIEYKTLEQELGIDLITLFKALKNNKVWVRTLKNNFHKSIECREGVRIESFFWLNVKTSDGPWVDYRIKDYGKTWALTKEELEQC